MKKILAAFALIAFSLSLIVPSIALAVSNGGNNGGSNHGGGGNGGNGGGGNGGNGGGSNGGGNGGNGGSGGGDHGGGNGGGEGGHGGGSTGGGGSTSSAPSVGAAAGAGGGGGAGAPATASVLSPREQAQIAKDLSTCQRGDINASVTARGFAFFAYGPMGHAAGFMRCMRALGYTFGDTPSYDLIDTLGTK